MHRVNGREKGWMEILFRWPINPYLSNQEKFQISNSLTRNTIFTFNSINQNDFHWKFSIYNSFFYHGVEAAQNTKLAKLNSDNKNTRNIKIRLKE